MRSVLCLAAALWAGRRGPGDGLLSRYVFVRAMQLQAVQCSSPGGLWDAALQSSGYYYTRDQIGFAAAIHAHASTCALCAKCLLLSSVSTDASAVARPSSNLRVGAHTCKITVIRQLCTHASRSDSTQQRAAAEI